MRIRFKFAFLVLLSIICYSESVCAGDSFYSFPAYEYQNQEKAWWLTYYIDESNKKLYITKPYNNNCDHCSNEITEPFKKYLIMNDFTSTVSQVHITSLHDVKESSLYSRRDDLIYKYKQRGFFVVQVGFTWHE